MRLIIVALFALLAVPGAARAEWYEASSAHFVVYSNDTPERIRTFSTQLERYDKALRVFRGYPDDPVGPANRVRVYIVDGTADIERLISRGKRGRGFGVAGFYQPRAGGSVAFVPRRSDGIGAQAVLLHEYAHHFMYSMSPHIAYPQWVIEGWAEFHGSAAIDRDGAVAFGMAPEQRSWGLMDGNWLPVQQMMIAETLKLDGMQTEGLYGRGWLLIHYLTYEPKRAGQLNAYIRAINDGKTPLEAASVFGDLAQLDRDLERYKRGKIRFERIAASALPIGEVTLRRLTAGEAATMAVRVVSRAGVTKEMAPGVYENAKKAAGPFPNDAGAQLVLAEAAFDAEDFAAAEVAADRAIAADPSAVDAHIYKAMARMEIALKAKDHGKPTWTAIRKLIGTANRLDPDDPEPLMLYYRSYAEIGENPPKIAREGLYRAFELAPQDPELRMNAARVYMQDGDRAMARALLRPLAYAPHQRGSAATATRMIAEIDAGKTEFSVPETDAESDEEEGADGSE